ncbi:MAG TPA: hypothetical protein VFH51_20370 [Myxococcota bacterium]|nr:hypothetical protein [Myxococcota bacterium]
MMWLALVASLASLAPQAPGRAHTTVSFIGFSRGEAVCAWRETVVRSQGRGLTDRFSLVRIVETKTERTLGVFREGGIQRRDQHGAFIYTDDAILVRDNPEWARAGARSAWAHIAREGRFRAIRIDFKDTVVRLDLDRDVSPEEVGVEDKTIVVTSDPHTPVGYIPVARLMNGNLLPLGHFRAEASPEGRLFAEVQVYHSVTGRHIAILNHFEEEDGDVVRADATKVVATPEVPISSIKIGTMQLIQNESKAIQKMFKEMHPEAARDWDTQLGNDL